MEEIAPGAHQLDTLPGGMERLSDAADMERSQERAEARAAR
jgi:hypothetical protein